MASLNTNEGIVGGGALPSVPLSAAQQVQVEGSVQETGSLEGSEDQDMAAHVLAPSLAVCQEIAPLSSWSVQFPRLRHLCKGSSI